MKNSDFPTNTGTILKKIENALSSRDPIQFGRRLASLIKKEPDRWLALLHLNNIIPGPDDEKFREKLTILLKAVVEALDETSISPSDFEQLTLPLLSLNASFTSIKEQLNKSTIWEKPGIRAVYRFAAFVEDQSRLGENHVVAEMETEEYSPSTFLGTGEINLLDTYEALCENFQLVLAYSIHKFGKDFSGDIGDCRTPYEDPEFEQLVWLASLWLRYKHIWECVKYLGWLYISPPEIENACIYCPPDLDEFIRFEVAIIRRQRILSEIVAQTSPVRSGYSFTDTPELIEKIASSIHIPDVGAVWDGKIDIDAIQQSAKQTWRTFIGEITLDYFHYTPLLRSVKLGSSEMQVPWEVYWKFVNGLRLLAEVFSIATKKEVQSDNAREILRRVIFVRKEQLACLISSIVEIDFNDCQKVLNVLIFDPKLKSLEVWDTPFVSAGDDLLLFVPSIVKNGNPVRAAENIIAQWNDELFTKRGKLLEDEIKTFLKSIEGVQVQGPIRFLIGEGSEKKEIECDVVALWDDYLVFIEAKCTKGIFNASDTYRARSHIEKAIGQLNLRRDTATENWEAFKSAASDLELPNSPSLLKDIKLIAVTNVLHFTGWKIEEVIVTDEFCVRRFFGTADIEAFLGTEAIGSVGRIRNSPDPTAEEFFIYLEDPPQVSSVRDHLVTEPLWLPIIKETNPKVGILHAKYIPDWDTTTIMQEGDETPSSDATDSVADGKRS